MTGDFDNDGISGTCFLEPGCQYLIYGGDPCESKRMLTDWVHTPVYVYDDDSEMEPRGGDCEHTLHGEVEMNMKGLQGGY